MENPHLGSYKIYLLVPEDIDSCTARILNLSENFDWFSPVWRYRTRTRVWEVETTLAGFTIYKIPRASLDFMRVNVVAVEGMLFREPDNQTRIVGEARTSWEAFSCTYGYVGLLFAFIAFGLLLQGSGTAIAILVGLGVLAIIWGLALYWIDRRKKQLLIILTQAFAED